MDFTRMKYRVDILPETTKCVDAFPDIGDLAHIFDNDEDLPEDVDPDKVVRYLIYMYAPNTPLTLQIPDINKRKAWALKAVNIDADEGGFVSEGYNQLCMLSEEWAAMRFVHFCLLHDSGNLLVAHTNYEVMVKVANRLVLSSAMEKAADLKNLREELTRAQSAYETALSNILQQEANQMNSQYLRYSIQNQTAGVRPEEYIPIYASRKKVFPNIIP